MNASVLPVTNSNKLKGKCNDFLTYYFYCIMFNFLILLKMINYLGRYAVPELHFLHPAILFVVQG